MGMIWNYPLECLSIPHFDALFNCHFSYKTEALQSAVK